MSIYTLDANGEATDWLDLLPVAGDFKFHLVFSAGANLTLTAQESNHANESATKDDESAIETFTASATKQYSQPLPRFLRFKVTAYVGGSVVVSVAPGQKADGYRFTIGVEGTEKP